ncbi:MAG: DUF4190 domain-containing protein [Polyangiaceae bacterium]
MQPMPPPQFIPQYPGGRIGPPPAGTESKASLALIFGILSIFCFGILSGIPAMILGFMSRRDIERSGHTLGGGGMAIGGIITGALGSLMTLASVGFMVFGMMAATHAASTYVPPVLSSTPSPVAVPKITAFGAIKVVDLAPSGGSLESQLTEERTHALGEGGTILVQTTATWSADCKEISAALYDQRMQKVLTNVTLVRVDVDEFAAELTTLKMFTGSVPFFFKVDASAHPTDSVSGDEWDDNTAANIAPVLGKFLLGTLGKGRSHPNSPSGEALPKVGAPQSSGTNL